ncbi:hypothetical protein V6N13_002047 [Hibiscus sabdariffa]|uniref:Uncharacterized protein n=1 Tax=Hibiscus sabdariffa TaxID=183260 RepID=A0ABR2C1N9_9ROSI
MVKNLNLCPKQSESSLDESTGFIRLYRYPGRTSVDEACGMMEHTALHCEPGPSRGTGDFQGQQMAPG